MPNSPSPHSVRMLDHSPDASRYVEPPHFGKSPAYKRAKEWAQSYTSSHGDCGEETADLVLDFAIRVRDEIDERRKAIDQKCEEMIKAGGALIVLEFVAVRLGDFHPHWSFSLSGACLVAGMAIALIGKRPVRKPAMPSIKEICDGLSHDYLKTISQQKIYLATMFHPLCAASAETLEWSGRLISRAAWFLIAALALLLPTLFSITG